MSLPAPLKVLVVDDSAVVRQGLALVLGREGRCSVETAGDPLIALEKLQRNRPDVMVLDLEMPRMDGLTFLHQLMQQPTPLPVVVCSGLAGPGSEAALRALEEGAVEIIAKPQLRVGEFLQDSAAYLVNAVHAAARARVRQRLPGTRTPFVPLRPRPAPLPRLPAAPGGPSPDRVVAVGASTGGTEALRVLLQELPPDCPGLLVVQHMPEQFTGAFARRLHGLCRIEVKEAEDGDRVLEGRALIAPGNRHLMLQRRGGQYRVEVREGPAVSRHRPSVDVLFHSVARVAGAGALGLLLTGMGDDGAAGLLAMREAGASTAAQDEATSVVWGMPKEAIARGAAQQVLPLPQMADAVRAFARRRPAVTG